MREQIYQVYSFISGKKYKEYSALLEQTQLWKCKKIKEFQFNRLKSILEHAYSNTPYYRNKFNEAGIKPENIKNPADLKNLPFLTKDEIQNSYKEMFAQDKKREVKIVHTSGTIGSPLELAVDYNACAQYGAPRVRSLKWYNINGMARNAKIWNFPLSFRKKLHEGIKNLARNCILLSIYDLSDDGMEYFYKKCKRLQPLYLLGFTSAVFQFAQFLQAKPNWGKDLGFKIVIVTSEVIHDFQRELMEEIFACKVVAEYGCVEAGIIAYECPYGSLHMSPENVYLEIIKDGAPAKLGEYGEVVITSLCNYAMPLIRYRIGDISAVYDADCSCGVNPGFPLLKPIMGRTIDLNQPLAVQTYYTVDFVMKLGIRSGAIKEYQALRKSQEEILIKMVKGLFFDTRIPELIPRNIRKALGSNVRVEIEYVDEIKREPSGKKRYFVSEIQSPE